jgi:hypothetical protein
MEYMLQNGEKYENRSLNQQSHLTTVGEFHEFLLIGRNLDSNCVMLV